MVGYPHSAAFVFVSKSELSHLLPLLRSKLTVEHVLPQKPPAGSDWQRQFTREQQEHWLHRLGNLILLPGRLNSAASNKSFAGKRDAWQTMLEGRTVGMPLTDKVCQREQWDAEAAAEAQGEAVRLAFAVWRLHDVGATSATQH